MTEAEELALLEGNLEAFGVNGSITKVTRGTWSANSGARSNAAADVFSVRMFRGRGQVLKADGGRRVEEMLISILSSDLSFVPDTNDTINDGTYVRSVVKVTVRCRGQCLDLLTQRVL